MRPIRGRNYTLSNIYAIITAYSESGSSIVGLCFIVKNDDIRFQTIDHTLLHRFGHVGWTPVGSSREWFAGGTAFNDRTHFVYSCPSVWGGFCSQSGGRQPGGANIHVHFLPDIQLCSAKKQLADQRGDCHNRFFGFHIHFESYRLAAPTRVPHSAGCDPAGWAVDSEPTPFFKHFHPSEMGLTRPDHCRDDICDLADDFCERIGSAIERIDFHLSDFWGGVCHVHTFPARRKNRVELIAGYCFGFGLLRFFLFDRRFVHQPYRDRVDLSDRFADDDFRQRHFLLSDTAN